MIWYRVIFTTNELHKGLDSELHNKFDNLYKKIGQPEGMALYRTDFLDDNHIYYYLSMPAEVSFELEHSFARYKAIPIFYPEESRLNFVSGCVQESNPW
jgi:hypothetical protein